MVITLEEIAQRARTGNYLRHGDPRDADCILAQSFGYRFVDGTVQPGLSNAYLASIVTGYPHLPVIAQFEVADALPDGYGKVIRIEQHRQPGEYLSTHEVTAQAVGLMDDHGWFRPLLVAHPHHVPRSDAICAKLGLDTIVPDGLQDVPFDAESEQEWTRGPVLWGAHEDIAVYADHAKGWL